MKLIYQPAPGAVKLRTFFSLDFYCQRFLIKYKSLNIFPSHLSPYCLSCLINKKMNSLLFRCVRHLFMLTKRTDCGNISYSTFESHHFIEKTDKLIRLSLYDSKIDSTNSTFMPDGSCDGSFWIIKCEYLYAVFYINLVISNQFLVISLYYLYRSRKFFNRLRARYIGLTDRHGLRFILIFQTFT